MKNTRVTAVNTTWYLLALLICIFSTISCSEDSSKEIPQNWINVQEEPFTISYEGGALARQFTLAEGVNPDYVYVISGDDWCSATVDEGSKLNITVETSNIIKERKSIVTLVYDDQHKVELTVVQQAAPPTLVTEIKFSTDLNGKTIYIGETLDLNKQATVLPEQASTKELDFTIIEGETAASIANGILKGIAPGSVKIKATATDGSRITSEVTIIIGSKLIHDRAEWSITSTSVPPVADGTTGDKLPHLFDGLTTTYLSMQQNGKGANTNPGVDPAFTIDMKQKLKFNFLQWGHRSNQTATGLRVGKITMYGSNDNSTFETIQENIEVSNTSGVFDIPLNQAYTYRYIKIEYKGMIGTGSTSAQVSEFGLGFNYE